MPIIDAQVHTYERDHPSRPWTGHGIHGPAEVTADDMVAAMDRVGVDGAIVIPPYSLYRFNASYGVETYAAHPTRFRVVRPLDFDDPAVGETIEDWAKTPGAVGVRIVLLGDAMSHDPDHAGMNWILKTAGRLGLPVNMLVWRRLEQFKALAERNPDTSMLIDHIGMPQPMGEDRPEHPWADLPKLLDIAPLPNVCVKISGAPVLSKQPFPYADIWEPLGKVFDAFGIDRCLWGTDWTRTAGYVSFDEAVDAFRDCGRLSDSDKAALMGGTLQRVYNWK